MLMFNIQTPSRKSKSRHCFWIENVFLATYHHICFGVQGSEGPHRRVAAVPLREPNHRAGKRGAVILVMKTDVLEKPAMWGPLVISWLII